MLTAAFSCISLRSKHSFSIIQYPGFEIANEKLFKKHLKYDVSYQCKTNFPHTLANSLTDSAFPDSSVASRARLSLYPSFKSSGKFSAISANDLSAFCT